MLNQKGSSYGYTVVHSSRICVAHVSQTLDKPGKAPEHSNNADTMKERGGYGKWVLYWGPERSDGKWIVLSLVLRLTSSML